MTGSPGPAPSAWRFAFLVPGAAAIGWGGWLVVDHAAATRPVRVALLLAACAGLHDLVVAPLVLAVGRVLGRPARLPRVVRATVQGGLLVGAVLAAVAYPLVAGYGRSADVPSRNPLDYGRNLLAVLLVVGVATALTAVLRARTGRRARTAPVR